VTPFVTALAAPASTSPLPRGPALELPEEERAPRRADAQRGSDRGADRGSVADRLLDEAAALFRERGFERSSTRELAERLAISQPSLYHHVGSKQELLEKVCIAGLERLVAAIQAEVPGAESPVRALVGTHLEVLSQTRELQLTRLFEQDALESDAGARVRAHLETYAGVVSSLLRGEQEADRLRTDLTADQLTQALVNLVSWSLFWLPRDDAEARAEAEQVLVTVFLEGAAQR
jgi:AcrR family transcriptional regulator